MIERFKTTWKSLPHPVRWVGVAVLGVTLGGMLARWLDGDRRGMFDRIPAQAWWSGWWLWLLLVLLVFWFPYNFQAVPPGGWSSWLRVPSKAAASWPTSSGA